MTEFYVQCVPGNKQVVISNIKCTRQQWLAVPGDSTKIGYNITYHRRFCSLLFFTEVCKRGCCLSSCDQRQPRHRLILICPSKTVHAWQYLSVHIILEILTPYTSSRRKKEGSLSLSQLLFTEWDAFSVAHALVSKDPVHWFIVNRKKRLPYACSQSLTHSCSSSQSDKNTMHFVHRAENSANIFCSQTSITIKVIH